MKIKRIKNNKFKTNELALFLTLPLQRDTITMNALLPAVLRRGTQKYINQIEIGKQLEEMYGAFFNSGIDKTGNYCILKFYIEALSDEYIDENSNLAQKATELLLELVFNPLVENEGFNETYVKQEKENLKKIIESKKDNKELYAYNRATEEMFENDPYGINKNGYIDDLEKINEKNLYDYYKKVIQSAQINLIINGEDADNIKIDTEKYNNVTLEENQTKIETRKEIKIVKEGTDVTQGKLIIGMNAPNNNKYAVSLYNAILGGGANSKLFQNVREKASLAYYAGSRYLRRKDAIMIITGIELPNYDKAVKIIKQQVEDMKNENITQDEFQKAKQFVLSSIQSIKESQEDTIAFEFDQELFNENLSVDDYYKKISNVTLQDIFDVAKEIKINTIYYLEKGEE